MIRAALRDAIASTRRTEWDRDDPSTPRALRRYDRGSLSGALSSPRCAIKRDQAGPGVVGYIRISREGAAASGGYAAMTIASRIRPTPMTRAVR